MPFTQACVAIKMKVKRRLHPFGSIYVHIVLSNMACISLLNYQRGEIKMKRLLAGGVWCKNNTLSPVSPCDEDAKCKIDYNLVLMLV
jgi:hypothetical protein